MKKHNVSKVVLVTMLIFLLLTWIFPAAYYSGEYVEQGRIQMGLFDLFNYPLTALSYFGYIAFYIILVGGFYGILYKIPAYRSFLDWIVRHGNGFLTLAIMVVINALVVSICGAQIGLALFIPLIVSIILLMGYDKIVAAFVTVGSICAGLIGSTYSYTNLSILTSTFNLKLDYQIGVRFVILILAIVLVIFNLFMYIKKHESDVKIEKKTVKKVEEEEDEVIAEKIEVRKTTTKSSSNKKSNSKNTSSNAKKTTKSSKSRKSDNKAALKDEDIIVVKDTVEENSPYVPSAVSSKHDSWPFMVAFCLLFILFVLAFITWGENGFGVKLFDDMTKGVQEFKLFGFPIFAKVLGTINSFGNWSINDMFLPMFLVAGLLMIIYGVSFREAMDGFSEGAKKALGPASIVILLYTLLVMVTYHPFQMTIYKAILGITKGFNIATTTFVAILCGLFNSDIAYSFQSVAPYYASVVTNVENYGLSAIIFQSMYGLTMLVAPSSLALFGILSYLEISYKEWLKNVWKLLLELFVILLIIFIILALI